MAKFKRAVRDTLNGLLRPAGFQLLRLGESVHVKSFQPCKRTLQEARRAGLSVGEYIDRKFHVPGATQTTIDQMANCNVFSRKINRVCEIGPGSGRYLERIQRLCAPVSYEIYETDNAWSDWLARTFHVVAHEADGTTLGDTPSASVDLVHAHKVFVYLPFIVTCGYFDEMIRITKAGGRIVFDVVSENCMPDATMGKWITSKIFYPCIMPREFVVQFFARRQCSLLSGFFAPMMPGQSEYLVFDKDTA